MHAERSGVGVFRSRTDSTGTVTTTAATHRAVPRLAVWAVSILGALLGVLLAFGGAALAAVVDRATIASVIRADGVHVDGMSEAQAIELGSALSWWLGIGLVVIGALFVLAAAGYLVLERRHSDTATPDSAHTASLALFGAFVSVLTSFLPGSPLLGGGLAGYFGGGTRRAGATVGTLSGIVAVVPMVLLGGAVVIGVAAGAPASGAVADEALLLLVVGGSTLFSVVVTVALSGAGGALGSYFAADRRGD